MMTGRVKRCFELTKQILNLEYERGKLEEQLTMDECMELAALLYQVGNEKSNEAANLERYVDNKFNVRVLRK